MRGKGKAGRRAVHVSQPRLDRVTHLRRDVSWVAGALADRGTRFVPVWGDLSLLAPGDPPRPAYLSLDDVGDRGPRSEPFILLGVWSGTAYFAVDFPGADETMPERLASRGRFRDLRHAMSLMDAGEASLLAYAKAMAFWSRTQHFCGACGHPTEAREAGHVRVCANDGCRVQHFPRTDPAIIVLVHRDDRALLGRQPHWPRGRYSTIAGFVEPGECLETAVVREVREETAVEVESTAYFASQPWPFPRSLMLAFTAQATTSGISIAGGELEDAGWFSRADLEGGLRTGRIGVPMTASVAYRLIEQWFDAGQPGRLAAVLATTQERRR